MDVEDDAGARWHYVSHLLGRGPVSSTHKLWGSTTCLAQTSASANLAGSTPFYGDDHTRPARSDAWLKVMRYQRKFEHDKMSWACRIVTFPNSCFLGHPVSFWVSAGGNFHPYSGCVLGSDCRIMSKPLVQVSKSILVEFCKYWCFQSNTENPLLLFVLP